MVFGYEAPVARVERIMPVIAHHEVIILLESIVIHFFPIDVQGPIFYFYFFVTLVFLYVKGIL